jgi:hypothetical protein
MFQLGHHISWMAELHCTSNLCLVYEADIWQKYDFMLYWIQAHPMLYGERVSWNLIANSSSVLFGFHYQMNSLFLYI